MAEILSLAHPSKAGLDVELFSQKNTPQALFSWRSVVKQAQDVYNLIGKIPGKMPPKKLLSRKETAAILGCCKIAVKYHHGKSLLPTKNEKGEYLYDPDQVARLAVVMRTRGPRPGPKPVGTSAAAREAFRLFALSVSLDEIVLTLGLEPEKVFEWHKYFLHGYEAPPVHLTAEQQIDIEKHREKIKLEMAKLDLARERLYESRRRRAERAERDE
jgi:hypothetical protein